MSAANRSQSQPTPRKSSISETVAATPGVNSNVTVGVRVRAFGVNEPRELAVRMQGSTCQVTTQNAGSQSFTYDRCFWSNDIEDSAAPYCSQEDVFQHLGKPIVQRILDGYNCCLIAYGPTASGKTYSMFGPENYHRDGSKSSGSKQRSSAKTRDRSPSANEDGGADRNPNDEEMPSSDGGDAASSTNRSRSSSEDGLIPRIMENIFQKANGTIKSATCSIVEIYLEEIHDLLCADGKSPSIIVRADGKRGYHLIGVTQSPVSSFAEMQELLAMAEKRKTVQATAKNVVSSRAHTIVQLSLTFSAPYSRNVRLAFADLAGSERVKEAKTDGLTLEQTKHINLSLLSLGKCIEAASRLGHEGNPNDIWHFKDSLLTKLLKEYIGGDTLTTLLVTVAPGASETHHTLQALRFGDRAKHIRTHASIQTALAEQVQVANVFGEDQTTRAAGGGAGGPAGAVSGGYRVYIVRSSKEYLVAQLQVRLQALVKQEAHLRSNYASLESNAFANLIRHCEREHLRMMRVAAKLRLPRIRKQRRGPDPDPSTVAATPPESQPQRAVSLPPIRSAAPASSSLQSIEAAHSTTPRPPRLAPKALAAPRGRHHADPVTPSSTPPLASVRSHSSSPRKVLAVARVTSVSPTSNHRVPSTLPHVERNRRNSDTAKQIAKDLQKVLTTEYMTRTDIETQWQGRLKALGAEMAAASEEVTPSRRNSNQQPLPLSKRASSARMRRSISGPSSTSPSSASTESPPLPKRVSSKEFLARRRNSGADNPRQQHQENDDDYDDIPVVSTRRRSSDISASVSPAVVSRDHSPPSADSPAVEMAKKASNVEAVSVAKAPAVAVVVPAVVTAAHAAAGEMSPTYHQMSPTPHEDSSVDDTPIPVPDRRGSASKPGDEWHLEEDLEAAKQKAQQGKLQMGPRRPSASSSSGSSESTARVPSPPPKNASPNGAFARSSPHTSQAATAEVSSNETPQTQESGTYETVDQRQRRSVSFVPAGQAGNQVASNSPSTSLLQKVSSYGGASKQPSSTSPSPDPLIAESPASTSRTTSFTKNIPQEDSKPKTSGEERANNALSSAAAAVVAESDRVVEQPSDEPRDLFWTEADKLLGTKPQSLDIVVDIHAIQKWQEEIKEKNSRGTFTDEEHRQVESLHEKIAKRRTQMAEKLQKGNVMVSLEPTSENGLEDRSEALELLQEFIVESVLATDIDASNLALLNAIAKAFREGRLGSEEEEVDLIQLSESRGLLAASCTDGSLGYLRILINLYRTRDAKHRAAQEEAQEPPDAGNIDFNEWICCAMFNQLQRIPCMYTIMQELLRHHNDYPTLSQAFRDSMSEMRSEWNEFFSDICSMKKAIPKENRQLRNQVVILFFTHGVPRGGASEAVLPIDWLDEGADDQTRLSRACKDGDEGLVSLFLHTQSPSWCLPLSIVIDLVLHIQPDKTTCLIQAVMGGSPVIVERLCAWIQLQVQLGHVDRDRAVAFAKQKCEEGDALQLRRLLNRDERLDRAIRGVLKL